MEGQVRLTPRLTVTHTPTRRPGPDGRTSPTVGGPVVLTEVGRLGATVPSRVGQGPCRCEGEGGLGGE